MKIQQTLQQLVSNQANPAPARLVIELILDEPVQGITVANGDNLSAAKQPISLVEEPKVSMTRAVVKTMLRHKKEKASSATTCLNLRPPYLDEIAAKPYHLGYFF